MDKTVINTEATATLKDWMWGRAYEQESTSFESNQSNSLKITILKKYPRALRDPYFMKL